MTIFYFFFFFFFFNNNDRTAELNFLGYFQGPFISRRILCHHCSVTLTGATSPQHQFFLNTFSFV